MAIPENQTVSFEQKKYLFHWVIEEQFNVLYRLNIYKFNNHVFNIWLKWILILQLGSWFFFQMMSSVFTS